MPYKQENKENIYDFIHRWAKNKRDYGVEKHEIAPVSLKTSEAGAFLYSVSNGGFFNPSSPLLKYRQLLLLLLKPLIRISTIILGLEARVGVRLDKHRL